MSKFIVLEGIDGSGKSSLAKALANQGDSVFFEPTRSTAEGLEIRGILSSEPEITVEINRMLLKLFRIDRLWNLENQIKPGLKNGRVVLDRYFFSTAAYQGLDQEHCLNIVEEYLNDKEVLQPDLVLYLDVSVEQSLNRLSTRNTTQDVYEKKENLEKIKKNYMNIWQRFAPEINLRVIDASKTMSEILVKAQNLIAEA